MRILRRVGPDTLIPCFAVNIRDNKDVQIANEVNQAVFNDLSHISAEETSQRIPLIVTLSTMEAHKHPLKEKAWGTHAKYSFKIVTVLTNVSMKISIERTGKATVANLNLGYTLFTLKPHNIQQRPRLSEKGLLLFHSNNSRPAEGNKDEESTIN